MDDVRIQPITERRVRFGNRAAQMLSTEIRELYVDELQHLQLRVHVGRTGKNGLCLTMLGANLVLLKCKLSVAYPGISFEGEDVLEDNAIWVRIDKRLGKNRHLAPTRARGVEVRLRSHANYEVRLHNDGHDAIAELGVEWAYQLGCDGKTVFLWLRVYASCNYMF